MMEVVGTMLAGVVVGLALGGFVAVGFAVLVRYGVMTLASKDTVANVRDAAMGIAMFLYALAFVAQAGRSYIESDYFLLFVSLAGTPVLATLSGRHFGSLRTRQV